MGKLRIMNHMGDAAVVWDSKKAEAGDLDAQAAVKEAERIFKKHQAQGATAFRTLPGKTHKQADRISVFDPKADEIVIVPPMAGGS